MVGTMTLRMRKNNGRYRMRARSSSMGRVEGAQVASMMATWDSEPEKSALQRISRSCENIVAQMQMTEGRRSHVTLPDERVLDILIQPKLYAGELLDIVASHFNLKEKEYFGLTYAADTGHNHWLQQDRRVLEHDFGKKPGPLLLTFSVRFYVDSISRLRDSQTIELYYLQAKALVCKGTVDADSETTFELAAYALQIAHGDFLSEDACKRSVKKLQLLPPRTLQRHPSLTFCEERVTSYYKGLAGRTRGQCIVSYMAVAESLPTYGIHFYEVKDKAGLPWWLGLSHRGVSLYDAADKTRPRKVYFWKQLENLYFRDRKFSIEVYDPKRASSSRRSFGSSSVNVHVWFALTASLTKCIWSMAISQHQFYLDRRHTKQTMRSMDDIAASLCQQPVSALTPEPDVKSPPGVTPSSSTSTLTSMPSSTQVCDTEETLAALQEQLKALKTLKEKKENMQSKLTKKTDELMKLCLQEAEIIGELPKETPLTPGEAKPSFRRRIGTGFSLSHSAVEASDKNELMSRLHLDHEVQHKIVTAAGNLCDDPNATRTIRRQRKACYQRAHAKLLDLEKNIEETKKKTLTASCSLPAMGSTGDLDRGHSSDEYASGDDDGDSIVINFASPDEAASSPSSSAATAAAGTAANGGGSGGKTAPGDQNGCYSPSQRIIKKRGGNTQPRSGRQRPSIKPLTLSFEPPANPTVGSQLPPTSPTSPSSPSHLPPLSPTKSIPTSPLRASSQRTPVYSATLPKRTSSLCGGVSHTSTSRPVSTLCSSSASASASAAPSAAASDNTRPAHRRQATAVPPGGSLPSTTCSGAAAASSSSFFSSSSSSSQQQQPLPRGLRPTSPVNQATCSRAAHSGSVRLRRHNSVGYQPSAVYDTQTSYRSRQYPTLSTRASAHYDDADADALCRCKYDLNVSGDQGLYRIEHAAPSSSPSAAAPAATPGSPDPSARGEVIDKTASLEGAYRQGRRGNYGLLERYRSLERGTAAGSREARGPHQHQQQQQQQQQQHHHHHHQQHHQHQQQQQHHQQQQQQETSVETCSNGTADSGYTSDLSTRSPRSLKRQNIYLLQQYYSRQTSDPGFRKQREPTAAPSPDQSFPSPSSSPSSSSSSAHHARAGSSCDRQRASGGSPSALRYGRLERLPAYTTCSGFNVRGSRAPLCEAVPPPCAGEAPVGGTAAGDAARYSRKMYVSPPLSRATSDDATSRPSSNSSNNSNVNEYIYPGFPDGFLPDYSIYGFLPHVASSSGDVYEPYVGSSDGGTVYDPYVGGCGGGAIYEPYVSGGGAIYEPYISGGGDIYEPYVGGYGEGAIYEQHVGVCGGGAIYEPLSSGSSEETLAWNADLDTGFTKPTFV